MKRCLVAIISLLVISSCTKEDAKDKEQDNSTQMSEIEELRQEIEYLKEQIENLSPSGTDQGGVSVSDFEALKAENENLKAQVALYTSTFFEVDGLRFNQNGTLISTEKLENEVVEKTSSGVTLTTTRTYDAEGRVIDIMRRYSGYNSMSSIPYYWRQEIYEYSGKTCTKTTRTNKYGLAAGTPYEEVVAVQTYW